MHKLTKIVATISDKTSKRSMLKSLYTAGMNIVRINTAHQKLENTLQVVENVRSVSDRIAILLDTKGPEVRTTESKGSVLMKGSSIIVAYGKDGSVSDDKNLFVNYPGFAADVPIKARILISDGSIELKVNDKNRNKLFCKVMQGGVLASNRNVNVPGIKLKTPSLSAKDKQFIEFAVKHDIEFIAHSMVRNKQDILAVQNEITRQKGKVKVIAKIEDREGVANIDSILEHAYGILIARGTLAVEMPPEQLIIVQKKIIAKCIEKAKPVITATQMLLSMVYNPKPTRAEISDVANAIFDGTDAVMLSEETSIGKYPVRAVNMMSRIAFEVEKNRSMNISHTLKWNRPVQEFLIRNAALACKQIGLRAILVKTHSGSTALMASSFRAGIPVFAQCSSFRTMRELALVYGVFPSFKSHPMLKKGDLIAVLGSSNPSKGADFLQIKTV